LAGYRLVELPAAVVFEAVVMAAGVAEVAFDGGSAVGVVGGVVGVGVAGGYRQPIMMQRRSRIWR
jgi:hypothetical protein